MSEARRRMCAWSAFAAILLISATPAHTAEIQLTAEAAPNQIYLGESATLTIKVSGLSDAPEPDLSGIAHCTTTLQGSQNQSYQNVTIINGKMERTEFRGRVFTYSVTPTQAGRLSLSPIRLAHKGRVYQASGPEINVVGAEKQDLVLVRLESSRDTVIVDEPFDVTLSVSIRRLPGGYADVDPFDTSNPPDLTVPHLRLTDMPGLATAEEVQKLLQGLLISGRRAPGFGINGLTLPQDPLNSFFSFDAPLGSSCAIFRFQRVDETINGEKVLTYQLRTHYIPKQEDTYLFGPVTFKGSIFTAVNAAGQATPRRIFTAAPAITVRVVPPPSEGRPDSYVGAIGSNITAEATLGTQTCKVGDPLQLALTIRGSMSADNVRAPALSRQKPLTQAFRVYDDTVETEAVPDGKRFTYRVRPLRAGTLEFPPINVAYYDSSRRSYEIIQTEAIPLVAYQANQVQEDFIVSVSNEEAGIALNSHGATLTPAPITVTPTGAEPTPPWLSPWERAALALGPGLFILVAAGAFVRLRLTTTAESRRRRAEVLEGLRLVSRAERQASRSAGEARTVLVAGLRKYLAHRLGGTEGGITPRDAARLLKSHGVDAELSQELVDVLDRCFNAEYDPSAASDQDVHADARSAGRMLHRLEKMILTMLIVCGMAGVAGADTVRNQFLWEEANTHMAAAVEPTDYLTAAETYRELYARGVQNGPLLRNMGTAFLMAGRHDLANRALRGAEIYQGTTPAIKRNLILALIKGDPGASATLPWYRLPMFWHFGISLRHRMTITVVAISMGWLVGMLRLLGWRRGWRRILILVVAVVILMGSSVLISLHELSQIRSDLTLLSWQGPEK